MSGGQDEGASNGGWGLDEDGQGEVCPGGGGWGAAFCVQGHSAGWMNHQDVGGGLEEDGGGQGEEPG